jgi:hypothetical protein
VDEPVGVLADEDLARCRGLLEPRRRVDRVADDERLRAARLGREHLARVDPGADLERHAPRRSELLVELRQPRAHLGGRPYGAQGIVLVRGRHAEDRHHRVADELRHEPSVALDDDLHLLEVAREHEAQRLRVEQLAQARGPAHVREEHRHDLAGLGHRRTTGHGGDSLRAVAHLTRRARREEGGVP